MARPRFILLLSGGVESAVVAAMAADHGTNDLHAVFCDYGQKTVEREREAVHKLARRYGMFVEEVTMGFGFLRAHSLLDESKFTYVRAGAELCGLPWDAEEEAENGPVVPYRNMVFLSAALSYAGFVRAESVWVGFDPRTSRTAGDKTFEFTEAMRAAARHGAQQDMATLRPVFVPNIVAPLTGVESKAETVRIGEKFGVRWADTWSCYNALPRPCGACDACTQRIKAFKDAGVTNPDRYCTPEYLQELVVASVRR